MNWKGEIARTIGTLAAGFFICLFVCNKKPDVVHKPILVPDPEVTRVIDNLQETIDSLGKMQMVRYIKGDDAKPETLWRTIPEFFESLPISEYVTTDSSPVYYNNEKLQSHFRLTFGYKGKAKYFKLKPLTLTNQYFSSGTSTVSNFSGYLAGGILTDQNLNFQGEISGAVWYKRFMIPGRLEFTPIRNEETNSYEIDFKARAGLYYKIL